MTTESSENLLVDRITSGLEQLLKFIATHPVLCDQSARRQVAFKDIFAEIRARENELGVEQASVDRVRDQPGVRYWKEQIAIEMDAMGLVEDPQHWDLPV